MDNKQQKKPGQNHTVNMENRSRVVITGVTDTDKFTESSVLLYTCICAGVTAVLKLIWVVHSNRKKECTEWVKQSGTAGLWEKLAGVKTATRMHMSVPIACGCVIYMIAV